MEDKQEHVNEFKPGETINPGDEPATQHPTVNTNIPDASQVPNPPKEPPIFPTGLNPREEEMAGADDPDTITWTASEYRPCEISGLVPGAGGRSHFERRSAVLLIQRPDYERGNNSRCGSSGFMDGGGPANFNTAWMSTA